MGVLCAIGCNSCKAEEWQDPTVGLEYPAHVVAVPTGFHLARQDQLVRIFLGSDAEECSHVPTRTTLCADGQGRRSRLGVAGQDLIVCDELNFPVLPVAKAAAPASVIVDVHDRCMSALEHQLAAVMNIAEFDPGAVSAAAIRGAQPAHLPERIGTWPADQVLVSSADRLGGQGAASPDEQGAKQEHCQYARTNCQRTPRFSPSHRDCSYGERSGFSLSRRQPRRGVAREQGR